MILIEQARSLDNDDPLARYRDLFDLPRDVVYLDGNSLGALPSVTKDVVSKVVENEWGHNLIRSWNDAGWINAPQRVGAKIAPLIGAQSHEVIACDSTSVNLSKLISAALTMQKREGKPDRKVIVSEPGNFPTDLYVIEGLSDQGIAQRRLAPRDQLAEALDDDVALLLLTHVHYKTGAMFDMGALTSAAHKAGALVLWDLSHSGGAVPVDLNGCVPDGWGADFAVGCGYKYLNGGPGAPSYAFVAERHHEYLSNPISGWMGHAEPFAFSDDYKPAPGVSRLLSGTPPVLGLAALEVGVDVLAEIGMAPLVTKSRKLSEFFRGAMAEYCPSLTLVSPENPEKRGSQLSYRHKEAYALSQALIAKGIIGDFREPDILRFGFAPAYVRFVDAARAVISLSEILESGAWDAPQYKQKNAVT